MPNVIAQNLDALRKVKSGELTAIVTAAKQSSTSTSKDNYGVTTTILQRNTDSAITTGKTTEVRTFDENAYNRVRTEDFIERVDYLANAAADKIKTQIKDKQEQEKRLQKIEQDRKYFIDLLLQPSYQIDPEKMRDPQNNKKYYADIHAKIHNLFQIYYQRLIAQIFTDSQSEDFDLKKAISDLDELVKERVEKEGRPAFVNIIPHSQMIDAQFPKHEKTVPANQRKAQPIPPNSALQFMGHRNNDGSITVDASLSRSTSLSVIKLKGDENKLKRIALNREHALKEVTAIAKEIASAQNNELNDGDTLELNLASMSLITPWISKQVEAMIEKLSSSFMSETRQLKDHVRALKMLDGQTIQLTIDGKKINVKINISCMNIPVNIKHKAFTALGMGDPHGILANLQAEVNNQGWLNYCKTQTESLQQFFNKNNSNPMMLSASRLLPALKIDDELQKQISDLKKAVTKGYAFLANYLEKHKGSSDPTEYIQHEQQLRQLEEKLFALEEKAVQQRKLNWQNIPPDLNQLAEYFIARLKDKENPVGQEERKRLLQFLYFINTQKMFYTEDYKKHEHASFFAAQMCRANDLADVFQMANCKSARDRTGKLAEEIQTNIEMEREGYPVRYDHPDERAVFAQKFANNHEFSTSTHAIKSGTPGIRGNRVNWDGTGIDSKTSSLALIKLKKLLKLSPRRTLRTQMLQNESDIASYLNEKQSGTPSIQPPRRQELDNFLVKIKNPYLRDIATDQLTRDQFRNDYSKWITKSIDVLNAYFENTSPNKMSVVGLYHYLQKNNVTWLPFSRHHYANAIIHAQLQYAAAHIENHEQTFKQLKEDSEDCSKILSEVEKTVNELNATPLPDRSLLTTAAEVAKKLLPWTSSPLNSTKLQELEAAFKQQQSRLNHSKKSLFSHVNDATFKDLLIASKISPDRSEQIVTSRRKLLSAIDLQEKNILEQITRAQSARKLNINIFQRVASWLSSPKTSEEVSHTDKKRKRVEEKRNEPSETDEPLAKRPRISPSSK